MNRGTAYISAKGKDLSTFSFADATIEEGKIKLVNATDDKINQVMDAVEKLPATRIQELDAVATIDQLKAWIKKWLP